MVKKPPGGQAGPTKRARSRADDHPSHGAASVRASVPTWLPPSLFAALAMFLFREFAFSDRMLYGSDTLLGGGYVARELYAEALRTLGRVPGWAPHILGGTPFLEALSAGDSLYPPSVLLLLLLEPYRAIGWKLVLHVFLAGLFFFGWVRAIGGSRAAALLGGTAYMLAPFLVGFVHAGHDGKIFVTALAPLVFWATERHFARPGLASVAGIGLVVALVLYTTHFQMAYFLFGGVGLYAIFRTIQIARGAGEGDGTPPADRTEASSAEPAPVASAPESRPRRTKAGLLRFALFLVASVLGATGAAYQLFPAVDYVTEYSRRIQTTREAAGQTGRAWSSSYSMNFEEVMGLIVPEFAGNQTGGPMWASNTYWGRNPLKNNHEYAGLIVLLLAAVSFVGARRKQLRWFLSGLGLLGLAFALGANTPVWGLFYALVPGIRLFRAPGMVVFLFGFAAITLAALGLDRLLTLRRDRDDEGLARAQKVLWISTGVVAAIALMATTGMLTALWTSVVYPGIDERRLQILQGHLPNIVRGASLALVLAAATSGLVWAFAKEKIPPKALVAGLVLLVAFDEARVDGAFIQTLDFHSWAAPDPNIRALLERERGGEPYRLFSLSGRGQDVRPAMHGIELASGHHPNDLARYRELIGMVGSGTPSNLGHEHLRQILNVEYILWPDLEQGGSVEGPVVSRTQLADGRVYETLLADIGLPRARLLASAVVKSDAEAVDYILSDEHDPTVEVVLAEEPPFELDGEPVDGSVRWVERLADRLELEVTSDRPALLVIADNWYPAWHASVDGEEVDVLRAYHTLRAVAVPAGTSTVHMWYRSPLVSRSLLLSIVVLLGIVVAGAVGLWRERREVER
jgi:hypothetical protein